MSSLQNFRKLFREYHDYQLTRPSILIANVLGCWLKHSNNDLTVYIAPFNHVLLEDRFKIAKYLQSDELVSIRGYNMEVYGGNRGRNSRMLCTMMHGGMYELAADLLGRLGCCKGYNKVNLVGFSFGGSLAWSLSIMLNKMNINSFAYSMGSFGVFINLPDPHLYGMNIGCETIINGSVMAVDPVIYIGMCEVLPTLFINCTKKSFILNYFAGNRSFRFSFSLSPPLSLRPEIKTSLARISSRLNILDLVAQKLPKDTPLQYIIGWSVLHSIDTYLSAIKSVNLS